MRYLLILLTCTVVLPLGCASTKTKKQLEPDPALTALRTAAIEVHEEMMTASTLMHDGKPRTYEELLPKDYSLMVAAEFKWVGPAWPAVKALAESVQYKPLLQGRRPTSDPVVNVASGPNSTVYDLLSDINWQIRQSKGQIRIDSINREIILIYK